MTIDVRIVKNIKGFTLDVSWQMADELLVLFGQSGSGKSLTLQAIAGLIKPDSGTISYGDVTLFDSEQGINLPPARRAVGYVWQDCALFPHMTVRENIAYGLRKNTPRSEVSAKIDMMLESLHIADSDRKLPREISGGQKQRVAFARALIGNPGILLLDEPFSALDGPLREEMRELLLDVRRKFGIPTVLVTHDLFEAWNLADRLVVYSKGQVALSGTPYEVMNGSFAHDLGTFLDPIMLMSSRLFNLK